MRGKAARQATMLTAVTPDTLVAQRHPIPAHQAHGGPGPDPAFSHL